MQFIDYYLKAANVLESCQTPEHFLVALNYLKLLKKKFPKEEAVDNLKSQSGIYFLTNVSSYRTGVMSLFTFFLRVLIC